MNTDALIGKVITRAYAIEKLLRKHYPATKGGLFATINSLADTLLAILVRAIKVVAVIRNEAAHPDAFKPETVPPDFDRLCNEIELLIPYFASQQYAKPTQPTKASKSPAAKPQLPAASSRLLNLNDLEQKGVVTNVPANHGKPWTPEEDTMLMDSFDAQTTIPDIAKAHKCGVGSIQNRLIKLGKLTADQYRTYPPESQ